MNYFIVFQGLRTVYIQARRDPASYVTKLDMLWFMNSVIALRMQYLISERSIKRKGDKHDDCPTW